MHAIERLSPRRPVCRRPRTCAYAPDAPRSHARGIRFSARSAKAFKQVLERRFRDKRLDFFKFFPFQQFADAAGADYAAARRKVLGTEAEAAFRCRSISGGRRTPTPGYSDSPHKSHTSRSPLAQISQNLRIRRKAHPYSTACVKNSTYRKILSSLALSAAMPPRKHFLICYSFFQPLFSAFPRDFRGRSKASI